MATETEAMKVQRNLEASGADMAARLGIAETQWSAFRNGKRPLPKRCADAWQQAIADAGMNGAEAAWPEEAVEVEEFSPEESAPEESSPLDDVDPGQALAIHDAVDDHDDYDLDDDDENVDIDALEAEAIARLEELDVEPSNGWITSLFVELVEEGANELVRDRIIKLIIQRWYADETKQEQNELRSTLKAAWRREVRDFREQIQREQRGGATNYDDPNAVPTPEERMEVRRELWPRIKYLAEDPNVFDKAVEQVQRLGVANEDALIRLNYLSGTSRVTARPIDPLINGASSGGKSHVVTRTLRLFPDEDIIMLSMSSPLALVYGSTSLRYKILFLAEATPLEGDDHGTLAYILRVIVSEGRVDYEVTVKDESSPTGYSTIRFTREGPICLVVTTTSMSIHAELETRMTRYSVNESADQTSAVIRVIGAEAAAEDEVEDDIEDWIDLQRWIGAGPRRFIIPYAETLGELIPPAAVRFRRDFKALLSMISAHAILHQAQREVRMESAVVATLDDYAAIRDLASRVMEETAGKRPTERVARVVTWVEQQLHLMEKELDDGVKKPRRGIQGRLSGRHDEPAIVMSSEEIGNAIGLDRKSADKVIAKAISGGYLKNLEDRPRVKRQLVLGDRKLEDANADHILPTVKDLKKAWNAKSKT